MEIKSFGRENYQQAAEIYRQGVATGIAVFQTDIPAWEEWDAEHLLVCRIAVFDDARMLGWAAVAPVSGRCAFAGVAEVSVYVAENARGRGVGEFLLKNLIAQSENAGLWTLHSEIFAENLASIRIHEKCGFRLIGRREKIARKNNEWKDTVLLEKRSAKVGI